MKSVDYLLSLCSEKYRDMVISADEELLGTLMEDGMNDQKFAYYLSIIATLEDNEKHHELAGMIYHFHFNWVEDAYSMAFFHYWRVLELQDFSNYRSLNEFISISKEPNFSLIPQENLDLVKIKILELKKKRNDEIREKRLNN
ncbi:hypothetical protein ERX35_009335 [Macrococcus equipercicus]|uniref:Uncharacterized protein n=1 Tax=Macrococcus equipercicus TaxID=69967 RepID=A0ABQ6R6S5_9STAP|nr:hypothetical protein [Macrococcus equipercicus]KAA1037575.1 hypothetical protein ERX35_009335 [Macrococcus equipercicus]